VDGRAPATWIRELPRSTDGRIRVQLSPDFFVDFPVEVFGEHGPGYVSAEMLGVSDELGSDLPTWQLWFDDHMDTGREPMEMGPQPEWDEWESRGEALLQRLRTELGPDFDVRHHFITDEQMLRLGLPPRPGPGED
jgi:hypothetical protein